MLDIAISKLDEDDVSKTSVAEELLKEHRIKIPQLEMNREDIDVKKEKLTSDNAPEDFHIVEGKEYECLKCTVPFSSSEFIDDIFKTSTKTEGLSIHTDKIIYKEYSHDRIEGNNPERDRIRNNARKAIGIVSEKLDEFAADAEEFNQTTLPRAIATKLANEKGRRKTKAVH
jgi:hypothetical protein